MASEDSGRISAALSMRHVPQEPAAAVLLLHGGQLEHMAQPPSRFGLPALRMVPFGRAILRAVGGGVALGTVRYRYRGWNGDRADAARDAGRALEELTAALGPVPVVLVGHSMGGRAALRVAGHPQVRAVVALAPWCPLDEPVAQLAGRRAVLLHCPVDRVTDACDSWELVNRARAAGVQACGVAMPSGGHTMLRTASDWHRLTTALVTGLLGDDPLPPGVAAAMAPGAGRPRITREEAWAGSNAERGTGVSPGRGPGGTG